MDLGIKGKRALVVGASKGIGRAIAVRLAEEGADVCLVARSADLLEHTAQDLRNKGFSAVAVPADVAQREEIDRALGEIKKEGAPLLVILCAAALYKPAKLHNVPFEDIDGFVRADLLSALRVCQHVLPEMMKAHYGRIVAISSLAAKIGVAGGTSYCAIKGAFDGMMRGIAVDYGRYDIAGVTLELGPVATERLAGRIDGRDEHRERIERGTSLRRLASPQEAADLAVWLCSKQASWLTGSVVQAGGGAHLNNHV